MKGNTHYFILTANPFVDAGIYVIEAYYEKNFSDLTPKDLETKISKIANLYLTDGWRKNLRSIFTINSKFTNPKGKKGNAKKYLAGLLGDFSLPKSSGTCMACGIRL